MAFPVVVYSCESWAECWVLSAECWRVDAFELWTGRRLLRAPWTARRSNQSILKEINTEYLLEGLMLKLKLQYFGHLMQRANSSGKDPDAGKGWGQEERGTTEDEMVGWHHRLSGHEFEQTLGDGEGQGNPACCSACRCKVSAQLSDWMTEQHFCSLLQFFFYYFFLFFLPFPHLSSLFPFFVRGLLFPISALLPMSRIPGDLFFYLWMKFIITSKFTHVPPWLQPCLWQWQTNVYLLALPPLNTWNVFQGVPQI